MSQNLVGSIVVQIHAHTHTVDTQSSWISTLEILPHHFDFGF